MLSSPAVGAGFVVAGLVTPLILGRTRDDRLFGYVATLPALGLGAAGYVVFLVLYGAITGV